MKQVCLCYAEAVYNIGIGYPKEDELVLEQYDTKPDKQIHKDFNAPPVIVNYFYHEEIKKTARKGYNVPIDVDMNFDPNPILWTLENTLIPIRGHQTVPLL